RALIVALAFGRGDDRDRMSEVTALAASAGAQVVAQVRGRRERPDAALFAGRGKVAEIAERRAATSADLVIFDHSLSGVQQRNLEEALSCRVVDRATLILDIFAQRARSAEGKLQVELAQLNHMATRLVNSLRRSTRHCGVCTSTLPSRWSSRTPSDSFATCRTIWSRHSALRSPKRRTPICCCT